MGQETRDWRPRTLSKNEAYSIVEQAEKDAELWAKLLEGSERAEGERPLGYHTKVTPKNRALFLAVLARTGVVAYAAKAVGWSRRTPYTVCKREPLFKQAMAEARETALDVLRLEAFRRGVQGYERPIYQRGELVGTEIVYSDRMLELLLQQAPEHRPRGLLELPAGTSGELTFRWEGEPTEKAQEPPTIDAEATPED